MRTHGMMFHHFHDGEKHILEQGSISAETFEAMLDYYTERYNLIGADEYYYKAIRGKLKDNDTCVTFDDNLLCQYDIAIPILNKRNLTSFFFVYTSPLQGKIEKLEVYRHFRHQMFENIDDFYEAFFKLYEEKKYEEVLGGIEDVVEQQFDVDRYLAEYSFYTLNDRKFRYYRDEVLGQERYYQIMDFMLEYYNYDVERYAKILWCGKDELKNIRAQGHIIGLHSHTHPTQLGKLEYEDQFREYSVCKEILESCLTDKVVTASYPCGSINDDTEVIMKKLGIQIAFKETMVLYKSKLMIPRKDHANILKEMKENESNSIYE